MRLSAFVEIRRGEGLKAGLMFLYFFLLLAAYYVIKPVRNSLFLEHLGPEQLPYVYLATALVIGAVASLYARLLERFERHLLIAASTAFFILNLVLFWWFFRFEVRWMAALFYLWAAVFSVATVVQFWSIANEIFNPEEAKRLFGLVGGGGVLGGVVGGLLSSVLVKPLGTENLLLVSAGILAPCVGIILAVHRREERLTREAAPVRRAERPLTEHEAPWRMVKGSRYLLLLSAMMIVMTLVATLVDFEFNTVASAAIHGKDAKTAFFGAFFAGLSALSLFVQFFLTSPVLRLAGVGAALLLLPVSLGAASLSVLFVPALWSASALKMADGSLRYSLNQSTREILFLPVPLADKYAAKAFIDMSLQRWARGAAALIILAALALRLSWVALGLLTLVLCAVWAVVVLATKERYLGSLARLLGERPRAAPELAAFGAGRLTERGAAALVWAAEPGQVARLLAAPDPEVRLSALERLSLGQEPVSEAETWPLLEDGDIAVRERAYLLLCAQHGTAELSGVNAPWFDPATGQPPRPSPDVCAVEQQARRLLDLGRPRDRARAAALIAASPRPEESLVRALAKMVTDPSAEVRRAACCGAASLRDLRLVGPLLRALSLPCSGGAAGHALLAYGPRLARLVRPALLTGRLGRREAGRLCGLLAELGGEEAVLLLLEALARPELRLPALRALSIIEPAPAVDPARAEGGYRASFRRCAWAAVVRGDWEAFRPQGDGTGLLSIDLLSRALGQVGKKSFEEAMLWQSLLRPEANVAASLRGLSHPAKELRAASQELLENALPREGRRLVALMLSPRPVQEQAEAASHLAALPRRDFPEWLPELLDDPAEPVRLGAICAAGAADVAGPLQTGSLLERVRAGSPLEQRLARGMLHAEATSWI